jgi:hypothetical protein
MFCCCFLLMLGGCPVDETQIGNFTVVWPASDVLEERALPCPFTCGNITSMLLADFLVVTRTCEGTGTWGLQNTTFCDGLNFNLCDISMVTLVLSVVVSIY